MDGTDWEKYGTGNYEKCANCMVHCGYEPTAAMDAVLNPMKLMRLSSEGIRTEGEMAPEIDLTKQRPADFVFSKHVETEMSRIHAEGNAKKAALGVKTSAAEAAE
jgi:hypothetical protein